MSFIDGILGELYAFMRQTWQGQIFFWLWFVFASITASRLTSPGGRKAVLKELQPPQENEDHPTSFYRRILGSWLDRLDALFPARPAAPGDSGRTAWSGTLYDGCLRLAVVYPILSVLVYWALSGEAGRIGELEVLPAEDSRASRAATVGGLALFAALLRYAVVNSGWRSWVASAVAVAGAFAVPFAFTGAVAVAGAFVVAVAFAVAGAFAVALAFAVAFALAFAVAFAVAVAVAGAIAVAVAFAVAFASAFAVEWYREKLFDRFARPTASWLFWTVAMGIYLLGGAFLLRGVDLQPSGKSLLVFMALLPFVNALFDFLSIGITRFALRKALGADSWPWRVVISFLDLFCALVCLLGLGCALIAGIHAMSWAAGQPLLDLQGVFDGIAREPGAYWWLYATLFSTLLPTLAHVLLMWVGIGYSRFNPLNDFMARCLELREEKDDPKYTWRVGFLLPIQLAAFTGVAIIGLVYTAMFLWEHHPGLGYGFLYFFEWFAQLIGAAVEPTAPAIRVLRLDA